MKLAKYTLFILFLVLSACGSSERVITEDGKIYDVKGDTFKNNGVDVTNQLSEAQKQNIKNALEEKIEAKEAAEKRESELEKKQKELEKIQEEAKRKAKELEEKQEALEKKQKELQDARDDFAKAKQRLQRKKEKYQALKGDGKLSPKEDLKWQSKIKDLEAQAKHAKELLDKLNY